MRHSLALASMSLASILWAVGAHANNPPLREIHPVNEMESLLGLTAEQRVKYEHAVNVMKWAKTRANKKLVEAAPLDKAPIGVLMNATDYWWRMNYDAECNFEKSLASFLTPEQLAKQFELKPPPPPNRPAPGQPLCSLFPEKAVDAVNLNVGHVATVQPSSAQTATAPQFVPMILMPPETNTNPDK